MGENLCWGDVRSVLIECLPCAILCYYFINPYPTLVRYYPILSLPELAAPACVCRGRCGHTFLQPARDAATLRLGRRKMAHRGVFIVRLDFQILQPALWGLAVAGEPEKGRVPWA